MIKKLQAVFEYLWYSLFIHILLLGFIYTTNEGKLYNLWTIFITFPLFAICLYKINTHFKKGMDQMKDSLKNN
ncbi:hypothetical protein AF332_11450 [Sporosarcina globispora]|uniref:Uncharacterized protein n=1 Tax=Sporosarcina globispora TaxID=1459 RepID=A0A0M0GC03_SPOGL|nr:hypothetical protein [Sporosarcina globispora]KON87379.1 hypothetical protein AF332_11450 [Sporosarcina globispora]